MKHQAKTIENLQKPSKTDPYDAPKPRELLQDRGSSDGGGMLIHCLECPSALCHDCFPPNFRRVYPEERFWSEMQKRGWNTSRPGFHGSVQFGNRL